MSNFLHLLLQGDVAFHREKSQESQAVGKPPHESKGRGAEGHRLNLQVYHWVCVFQFLKTAGVSNLRDE